MIMNKKRRMEEERSYMNFVREILSGTLSSQYPQINTITIKYTAVPSSFMSKKATGKITLKAGDSLYTRIKCPNYTCTEGWIDITEAIKDCLNKGISNGAVLCSGKESDKVGAKGCLSEVEFVISVESVSDNKKKGSN